MSLNKISIEIYLLMGVVTAAGLDVLVVVATAVAGEDVTEGLMGGDFLYYTKRIH